MPGDVMLRPDSQIVMNGTDTVFDNTYMIDMISRSLNARQGFTQIIRAHAVN
jgi:hypothetical protein